MSPESLSTRSAPTVPLEARRLTGDESPYLSTVQHVGPVVLLAQVARHEQAQHLGVSGAGHKRHDPGSLGARRPVHLPRVGEDNGVMGDVTHSDARRHVKR